MSRYIDAEWLLGVADLAGGTIDVDDVYNAPSIDIVRCRECKHGGVRNDADIECKRHKLIMRLNDFCSYGQTERSSE